MKALLYMFSKNWDSNTQDSSISNKANPISNSSIYLFFSHFIRDILYLKNGWGSPPFQYGLRYFIESVNSSVVFPSERQVIWMQGVWPSS